MAVFQAVGHGFSLTRRLWFSLLAVLVSFAAFGALASVLLPYEVKPPQVQRLPVEQGTRKGQLLIQTPGGLSVPEITTPEQFRQVAGPALGLFFSSSVVALYLLAGILGNAGPLLKNRKERCSPSSFLRASNRWFWPMLRWAFGLFVVAAAVMVAVSLLMAVAFRGKLGAAAQLGKEAALLPVLLFRIASLLVTFLLVFSPVILVEKGLGVWRSFAGSVGFLVRHFFGFLGLFLSVIAVATVVYGFGLVLAQAVDSLRASLGAAPYAAGWPVFFFQLILGIPQAYLTVLFPCVLYAYYVRKESASP